MAKKKELKERIKTLERELFIVCCHPESLEAITIKQRINFLGQMETVIWAGDLDLVSPPTLMSDIVKKYAGVDFQTIERELGRVNKENIPPITKNNTNEPSNKNTPL